MVIRPRRSFAPSRTFLLTAGVILAILVLGVAVGRLTAVHPRVARSQAIAAVVGTQQTSRPYPRVEAKYMRRSDVEKVIGSHLTAPDAYVWVVAISGDWGPPGEHQQGPVKSALAVIEDRPGLHLITSSSSTRESWPSSFDRLPDLSSGF